MSELCLFSLFFLSSKYPDAFVYESPRKKFNFKNAFYVLTARYHRENWITNRLSSCVYLIPEQLFF